MLCEIELTQDDSEEKFEQAAKTFGINSSNEVTGKTKYENENIAATPDKENNNPWDYIKYLENRLKGKTVVVALQGLSLFNKITDKNSDKNDREAQ
ncbi:hypothetical protein [Kosmotoga sp. DU53]|uniref:hypothetical protein n=1 Tax=Kosmotoga sp. DU53 TaxID=1310160 RepID=UPI0007C543A1|nr:hypothetical protein [Kosmotoga sp. DU53]OAA23712.1 hypothetical protein DU53_02435 [Kosmotoga sp. DU53]